VVLRESLCTKSAFFSLILKVWLNSSSTSNSPLSWSRPTILPWVGYYGLSCGIFENNALLEIGFLVPNCRF
jgi:hypothetical protein